MKDRRSGQGWLHSWTADVSPAPKPEAEPDGPRAFRPQGPRGWHSRGYLPHFDAGAIPQFITFRLHASFSKHLLDSWKTEVEHLDRTKADEALRERIEEYLDSGQGDCWLREPAVAELVQSALLFFDGDRYRMHRWVVMPNHVHCLITPAPTQSLSAILHGWKSYTGNQANRILGRRGAFWDEDYFDRYIRDELNFNQVVYYIDHNPVKAKLCRTPEEWSFSSVGCKRKSIGGLEGRGPVERGHPCPPVQPDDSALSRLEGRGPVEREHPCPPVQPDDSALSRLEGRGPVERGHPCPPVQPDDSALGGLEGRGPVEREHPCPPVQPDDSALSGLEGRGPVEREHPCPPVRPGDSALGGLEGRGPVERGHPCPPVRLGDSALGGLEGRGP